MHEKTAKNSISIDIKEEKPKMKNKNPTEKTTNDEQFDKAGNLVCPTCKKSLDGLKTSVSESLVAPEKHTTQKRKVQCCSEECSAKFFEKQLSNLDEE